MLDASDALSRDTLVYRLMSRSVVVLQAQPYQR